MSRSGRLRPRLAFVTILAHPTEPGDPPRLCALNLGDTRARSGTLGCNRSRSGLPRPRARLALAPHLAELGTVMLRGPLPHTGAESADRRGIRRGRGAGNTETFPLAAPGGCLHPRRVLGPKEVLATLLCTPRLHVVPCLGPRCPRPSRPSGSSCLKSLALQPQFPLLDFLGYRVQ